MPVRRLNVGDELATISVVTLSGEEVRPMTQAEVDLHNSDCDTYEKWEAEEKYKEDRKAEYPPMEDQLDYIFHHGVEKWKEDMIIPVKNKYPKE